MLVCIDIGNTNIVLAVHDGKSWIHTWRVYSDEKKTGDEYYVIFRSLFESEKLDVSRIDNVIISSVVPNLTRELKTLKDNGFWIYGADMSGEDSYTADFPARTAIVMGSEGDGISQLVRKNCDYIVSIPMRGHIDSLNVSVAAGILLYEFRRPRNQEMK